MEYIVPILLALPVLSFNSTEFLFKYHEGKKSKENLNFCSILVNTLVYFKTVKKLFKFTSLAFILIQETEGKKEVLSRSIT